MPLYTEHLNLAKPTREEKYNIAVPNSNMDILDETVQQLWEKKADKGPQERFVLTGADPEVFAETEAGYYSKDPMERVVVELHISDGQQDTLQDGTRVIVGSLPEGFRPYGTVYFSVLFISHYRGIASGYGAVGADGIISVIPPVPMPAGTPGFSFVSANIVFDAVSRKA